MKSCAFTVCNIAYLPRALVLAESMLKTSKIELKIVLFESRKKFSDLELNSSAEILFAEEFGFLDFQHLAMIYDVVELTTALKPRLTKYFCQNHDYVYFFDPDVVLYDDANKLQHHFGESSVLLTPHFNSPEQSDVWNDDVGLMRFGAFNLGFFAVRTCEQSKEFLDWWDKRCTFQCFFETQFGLSTDQKWLNVAFAFFDCFKVLRSPIYNFAYWNAFERFNKLRIVDGVYMIDGDPLFFAHISSFNSAEPHCITNRGSVRDQDKTYEVLELFREYAELLNAKTLNMASYTSRNYTYDYFETGEKIGAPLRIAYLDYYKENGNKIDPFNDSDLIRFAKRHNLLGRDTTVKASLAQKEEQGVVIKLMRIFVNLTVRVVGSKRYRVLCNGFLLLSSPRTLSHVWNFRK
ncbi:hypothetical protein GN241_13065 [Rhodobacteraceae bacterium IMCC1335]